MTISTCTECGFDATRWSPTDLRRTIAHGDDLVGHVVGSAGPATLERVAELDPLSPVNLSSSVPPADHVPDDPVPAGSEVDAVHAIMHRLHDLAAIRRAVDGEQPLVGAVRGLHRSGGGVPKLAVEEVEVDLGGVRGDAQATRQHHGRPWQALCLFSADVLDALHREGHPIAPGTVGENVLIGGIDWSLVRGGHTVTIGEVVCRTSAPADPCRKVAASFVDGDHHRVDHARHPGWSRWYASVLDGGVIRLGDRVTVSA